MKVTAELRNWFVDPRGVYWGLIYNDSKKRYKDGVQVHTSLVQSVEELEGGESSLIHTLNSIYLIRKDQELKPDAAE